MEFNQAAAHPPFRLAASRGERVGGARLGARPGRAETTLDAASLHAYAELQAALGEAAGPSASVTSTEEAAPRMARGIRQQHEMLRWMVATSISHHGKPLFVGIYR